MKILNLYAGIGGNRKLWKDVEVTAVENNPKIAKIYQDFFPNDKVIVTDAHKYLLENFDKFDFIWSSPPCPSHSQMRYRLNYLNKDKSKFCDAKPLFPDMKLYEEIIFLKYYFKGQWVVENVISYYEPLIKAQKKQRHYFWSNFSIPDIELKASNITHGNIEHFSNMLGFDVSKYKGINKNVILKNCVHPKLGLHVFKSGLKIQQTLCKFSI